LSNAAGLSRRGFFGTAALASAGLMAEKASATFIWPLSQAAVPPALMKRALASFQVHGRQVAKRDVIGIADFNAPSSQPRFHLVDLIGGRTTSLLVSHGRGSDPAHTGWLETFSNADGSNCSSRGAYLTGDTYVGKHGTSRRLIGLDSSNNNAEPRAIVIHAAWYVSPDMVRDHGKLGRSEGCLAVSERDLAQVLSRLGGGHFIYADKV
jgi:hypothetical protein